MINISQKVKREMTHQRRLSCKSGGFCTSGLLDIFLVRKVNLHASSPAFQKARSITSLVCGETKKIAWKADAYPCPLIAHLHLWTQSSGITFVIKSRRQSDMNNHELQWQGRMERECRTAMASQSGDDDDRSNGLRKMSRPMKRSMIMRDGKNNRENHDDGRWQE
jgi:hypothetical protein